MKFDYVIGNPPYQEETEGTSDKPIYNFFMDAAFTVSDKVELITPARFLFNAGKTPKAWNAERLSDSHFKVMFYEQDSSKVFGNTDIKGGVAVTYRDTTQDFGAIEIFTHFSELNSLLKKVKTLSSEFLNTIMYSSDVYKFTEQVHKDCPNIKDLLSKGHENDIVTNIFDKLDDMVFFETKPDDDYDYVRIYGRKGNNRVYEWVRSDYIISPSNFNHWKVILPKSNGSGAIGEVLSTPLVGTPLVGHTQTFITVGSFDTEEEAQACLKYIKTKFARACLGILKITQHNPPDKWKYVPLQDFTENSDIDWSVSIPEIDRQLYKKYGLSEEEIDFIETHVKEMV